ncbi:hypothetical protein [Rhizorhabdus dicambivorans]|uniref:Glycosyltransferase RgtA/B/C/D-like domain-containing protein n=1 Tax=Rhizorhabdus dicambivorans TaxID=1850238 RepID=A0A2A4FQK4_9SPHN|nr:hypothetical protein [Rhizorhabdus dicambivorans]ATE66473.1 hypothetical protein CMV14_20395 [Rhizorhabdus dicambivorans]PCE41035.1 hypothetical protein COO09_16925 [Rhizorhabdus dicambivorans]
MNPGHSIGWWRRPGPLAAILLVLLAPLLLPGLPPLTDLPGHVGRWHIATADPASPLHRYYAVHWAWMGNLGTDLIALPLIPLVGPVAAARLIAGLILLLTGAALLWLSREVHGRVAPSLLFALPFAYGWPFQMGFVNFALAQALGFAALALWLRLARAGRLRLRALLFAPVGLVLWTAHSFGWGMFGLMAFAAELARLRARDHPWPRAIGCAVVACLPLALPALVMALGRPAGARASETGDWFNMGAKFLWLLSSLRDRWQAFDIASLLAPLMLIYIAARDRRLGFSALLGWPALACAAAFLLLPRLLLGGSYVDMRMAPAIWMLALLAIRPPETARLARMIALAGLAFVAVRTAGTMISFAQRGAEQRAELSALPAIPRGAAVLALVARPCLTPWSDIRPEHLAAYAILTRDAFVNEQWAIPGQHYLTIRHRRAMPFVADPSQLAYPDGCREQGHGLSHALAGFPRAAFTHLWIIGHRLADPRKSGLVTVWSNGRSGLYQVVGTAAMPRVEPQPEYRVRRGERAGT